MNIKTNLEKIINIVKNIVPIKEAYLFGSYAYGMPNDNSDYDLYFIVDENLIKYETVVKIRAAIYEETKKSVDVRINTKENFEYRAINKSTLEHKILKDGVKLI